MIFRCGMIITVVCQYLIKMPDHVRFSVDLDLDAPKIMIPARIARTGGDDTQLLLDLGHFTLHTAHVSGTPCGDEK
jgi:hypothetical protein